MASQCGVRAGSLIFLRLSTCGIDTACGLWTFAAHHIGIHITCAPLPHITARLGSPRVCQAAHCVKE